MPYSAKEKSVIEQQELEEMIVKAFEIYAGQQGKDLEAASLIAFLWLSGARISEALALKPSEVKEDEKYVYVTIHPLKQWTKTKDGTKKKKLDLPLIFPKGKSILTKLIIKQTHASVNKNAVWDFSRITAWRRITEINDKIYPHIFRSTRATLLADKGMGDDQLKRWLGWAPRSHMPAIYIRHSKLHMSKIADVLED